MKLKKILLAITTVVVVVSSSQNGWCQKAGSAVVKDTAALTAGSKDSSAITAVAVAVSDSAVVVPLSDSAKAAYAKNAALGKDLFLGIQSLENGGPSCISCHNATAKDLPEGGLLAKDLTHVYARLGEAGIPAILGSTPFPAMASAYQNKPLTTKEMTELTAFFKQVEETAPKGEPQKEHYTLLIGGTIGLTVWLGLIFGLYFNRKKNSVKQAIYARQIH